MTPTNCPNCGAVVHGVQCEYCGTQLHDEAGEVIRAWGSEPVLITFPDLEDVTDFERAHDMALDIARRLFTNEARPTPPPAQTVR